MPKNQPPPQQQPQRPKRRRIDPDDTVAVAADDSFPASDPPAWIELSVGRKRKKPAKPTSS
ncbi:hypothetical protein [Ferrovibrio sp.]|uniref:hypothetical protein n=1 Tax=Ferrovibrio sp. TaxID=1917215 RepID=UPI003D0EAF57